MAYSMLGFFLLGALVACVHGSGLLPAPGIAYTRAIPYNVPPFAAAVSFIRTGPKAVIAPPTAILPPHLHAFPKYSPYVPTAHIGPHVHSVPSFHGFGVPAVLPHAASLVPHVGVLPAPVAPVVPAPVLPHVPAGVPLGLPHAVPHVHTAVAPAVVGPAPVLPHAHLHGHVAPLVAPNAHLHGHYHH